MRCATLGFLVGCTFWSARASAGSLFATDFGPGTPTLGLTASGSGGATATAEVAAVGTIDDAGGTRPSPAVRLTVRAPAAANWSDAAVLGPTKLAAPETDLRKVTLAFMASVSTLQPIRVRVESINAAGTPTGAAVAEIFPAAPDFYQRYALDLSTLKTDGGAGLDLRSPQVRFSFALKGEPGLPPADTRELRVDNVQLAGPSYYVSPTGDDTADGRTEATALATPQTAVNRAQPGDVILLKGGEYRQGVSFPTGGRPAEWIVLKNAPGETPVLHTSGWIVVKIGLGSKEEPSDGPTLAYLEVRGLTFAGSNRRDAQGKPVSPFPNSLGKAVAETNSNGLLIEGRSMKQIIHHIRVADCISTANPGVGIASCYADWLYFENNVATDNSWFTNYATSGFSILYGANFDGTAGGYRFLVSGNRSAGNRCYQSWTASYKAPHKLSDGNGIIIDTLVGGDISPTAKCPSFKGRTLVVNNISFNNGGSGIHQVSSPNVDVVNNTVYLNGQTPETKYSQMFGYRSPGSNYVNNIVVAPQGQKYNLSSPYGEQGNTEVIWSHNLLFGSETAPRPGSEGLMADPLFAHASPDPKSADFSLRPGSAALGAGTREVPRVPVPLVDIDGHRRPLNRPPAIGASQPK